MERTWLDVLRENTILLYPETADKEWVSALHELSELLDERVWFPPPENQYYA
jgi:hypothetical protein